MSSTPQVVILSAARTAIGKFGGSLSTVPAVTLGAHAMRAAIERSGIDVDEIDEVIMGQVIQAGAGMAPARQAAIRAGIPPQVGAMTLNKVCGSGLKAVMIAASHIKAGEGCLYIGGGMENMNAGPYLLANARNGYRLGHGELLDATVWDGLRDPFSAEHVALSAEWLAEEYNISRADQDAYAYESHRRAAKAIDAGLFSAEIAPMQLKMKGNEYRFDTDEGVRRDTSMETLTRLRPAFKEDGRVTAGNAPSITDGAAALVVAERQWAETRNLAPLAIIRAYASHALEPNQVFAAPPGAIRKVLALAGWQVPDIDLFEINEAFAAQILHTMRALQLDRDRVNIHGGAIALGHPLGASGARVLTTLIYALRHHQLKRGIASLCLGGGEAVAMAVELIALT